MARMLQIDFDYSSPFVYNSELEFIYYKYIRNDYSTTYYFAEFQDNGTAYEQVLFDVSLFNISNASVGFVTAVQTSKTLLIVTRSADYRSLILWSLKKCESSGYS